MKTLCADLISIPLEDILATVKSDRKIQRLVFQKHQLRSELTIALAKFLKDNNTLIILDLKGNLIGKQGIKALMDNLTYNTELRQLSISDCNLASDDLRDLVEFLKSGKNQTLSYFNISYNKIEDDMAIQLIDGISCATTQNLKIDLRHNWINEINTIEYIADSMKNCHNVIDFILDENEPDLYGDNASRELTMQAVSRLNAARLKLDYYLRQNRVEAQKIYFAEFLGKLSASIIVSFALDGVNISINDTNLLCISLSQNSSLIAFSLRNNALCTESICRICKCLELAKSIRQLSIIDNNMGDIGLNALAKLVEVSLSLREVVIRNSNCIVQDNDAFVTIERMSQRTGYCWYNALAQSNTKLRVLELENCGLNDVTIGAMLSGLAQAKNIKVLNIRGNELTDASIDAITSMISQCNNLRHLDVSHNHFTLFGSLPCIKAATNHPSLFVLRIGRLSKYNNESLKEHLRFISQSQKLAKVEFMTIEHFHRSKELIDQVADNLWIKNGWQYQNWLHRRKHKDYEYKRIASTRAIAKQFVSSMLKTALHQLELFNNFLISFESKELQIISSTCRVENR